MPRGSREGIRHASQFRWAPWRERFEANVDRTPGFGPWGNCHRWTGSVVGYPGNQYGVIGIDGKQRRAHQVAWEIAHAEPFPTGKLGLHSCDVGVCVNADHVHPGTQAENMREARERGRLRAVPPPPTARARGNDHGLARFGDADIVAIRHAHAAGGTISALARQYGVGWSTIDKIVKRKTWRHVD